MQLVHEVGVMDERTGHLEGHEAGVEHLLHVVFIDHTSHVNQRHLHRIAELHGCIIEIRIFIGHSRDDDVSAEAQTDLQPPELLHVHIVSHGLSPAWSRA